MVLPTVGDGVGPWYDDDDTVSRQRPVSPAPRDGKLLESAANELKVAPPGRTKAATGSTRTQRSRMHDRRYKLGE